MSATQDGSDIEAFSPVLGNPLRVLDVGSGGESWSRVREAPGCIRLGIDRLGLVPAVPPGDFDLLLSVAPHAPRPWVTVEPTQLDQNIAALERAAESMPLTAAILAEVLRVGENLAPDAALTLESLAYSTLLAGEEFRRWRISRPVRDRDTDATARVRLRRTGDALIIELAASARRNAFDARMRDELVAALHVVEADVDIRAIELRAQGPHFSSGGDLDEFGSATDLALAHAIRTLRSPVRLLMQVSVPSTAYLHGGCIGAGIEIPAAARRVVATPDTWMWLPEVAMGLIPAAGGTVSIARRIGRHRMLYWALAGHKLDSATALDWGLIDAIEEHA